MTWRRFAAICAAAGAGGFVVGTLAASLVLDQLVKRSVRL